MNKSFVFIKKGSDDLKIIKDFYFERQEGNRIRSVELQQQILDRGICRVCLRSGVLKFYNKYFCCARCDIEDQWSLYLEELRLKPMEYFIYNDSLYRYLNETTPEFCFDISDKIYFEGLSINIDMSKVLKISDVPTLIKDKYNLKNTVITIK